VARSVVFALDQPARVQIAQIFIEPASDGNRH